MNDDYNVSIPEPCPESWDKMTPSGEGRYCDSCCKVVVDFTSKTTNEIIQFIQSSGKQSICGRAYADQLSYAPVPVKASRRRGFFFAALYFVFGSLLFTSCHHHRRTAYGGKFLVEPKHAPGPTLNPALDPHNNKEQSK